MRQILVAALLLGYVIALAGCKDNSPQVPDTELMNTLWTLESIELPGSPDIHPGSKWTYPIQFFEDNRIEGGIDCNHLDGEYMLTAGDSIQFKNLSVTRIGCRDSSASLVRQYHIGLMAVHSYEITGNRLRLYFNDSVIKYKNVD